MKFNIKRNYHIPNIGTIYDGYSVLQLVKDTKVEVIIGSRSNVGDILKKIDDNEHPFECIESEMPLRIGIKWGAAIEVYRFKVISIPN